MLRRVLGDIDLDAKVAQIKETLKLLTGPSMRDLRRPTVGLQPIVCVGIWRAAQWQPFLRSGLPAYWIDLFGSPQYVPRAPQ